MTDLQAFTRASPRTPRHAAQDIGLADEAIRRGVQHLAFRLDPHGLAASYAPGPAHVNGLVARAARATARAHDVLAPDQAGVRPSPVRPRAVAARL